MIDGSFVEAPRQHNTREENKIIKEDRGGELWNPEEGDTKEEKKRKANKKRQKDMDKLQSFGFFVSYEWIKELILQRCLLILMFNGLRIKAGGSAKK